jgi:hypothetical protein
MRLMVRVCPLLLALALLAVPASAEVFYVTLNNGSVVETARQPEQASWDPNVVLVLTEVGNWAGFLRDEIEGIRSEDPASGFGIRISDTAIALGLSPNDMPDASGAPADPQAAYTARMTEMYDRLINQIERANEYSVQQGVSTDQTQGIPLGSPAAYNGVNPPPY